MGIEKFKIDIEQVKRDALEAFYPKEKDFESIYDLGYIAGRVEGWNAAIDVIRKSRMNLDEWAKAIHENAVEHGWWDEERSFAEIVALCHSELSEALEADRAGEPLIHYEDGKPEGAAVEMADCIIRILDWCGKNDISIEGVVLNKHRYNKTRPYKHGKRY